MCRTPVAIYGGKPVDEPRPGYFLDPARPLVAVMQVFATLDAPDGVYQWLSLSPLKEVLGDVWQPALALLYEAGLIRQPFSREWLDDSDEIYHDDRDLTILTDYGLGFRDCLTLCPDFADLGDDGTIV